MTEDDRFFVPPRARWRELRNHGRNWPESPWLVIWNFFLEQRTTA